MFPGSGYLVVVRFAHTSTQSDSFLELSFQESYGLLRPRSVRIFVSGILTACSSSGGHGCICYFAGHVIHTTISQVFDHVGLVPNAHAVAFTFNQVPRPVFVAASCLTALNLDKLRVPSLRAPSLRVSGGCNSCLSQVGRAHKFAWALESVVRADMEIGFIQGVQPPAHCYESSHNILQLTLLKRHFERGFFDQWSRLWCNDLFC